MAGSSRGRGFLDQRACLQWVQTEITKFGGDPTNVTAWGQSAGAQSAVLHMASAGSTGLFHRAVLESVCTLALLEAKVHTARRGAACGDAGWRSVLRRVVMRWHVGCLVWEGGCRSILLLSFSTPLPSHSQDAGKLGRATAKKLGCHKLGRSPSAVLACMRNASLADVISAGEAASSDWLAVAGSLELSSPTASFLPFKPNIDGVEFKEQPMKTLLGGSAPGAVPVVIGFNHDEMWALIKSVAAVGLKPRMS